MAKVHEWHEELRASSVYEPTAQQVVIVIKLKAWELFRKRLNGGLLKLLGISGRIREIFEELFGPEV
jgi:hypothetical protein